MNSLKARAESRNKSLTEHVQTVLEASLDNEDFKKALLLADGNARGKYIRHLHKALQCNQHAGHATKPVRNKVYDALLSSSLPLP